MPILEAMKKLHFILLLLCLLMSGHGIMAAPGGFDQYKPPDLMKDFELLRRRIRENPRDIPAINSIGIIYARAGKLDDAIRLWRHGIALDPRYIHLYNNLGSALKQMGRREEARLVFKTGLSYSASFWISYNLGLLEKEEGNPSAAAACFKNCLAGNPAFQPAINQLAELGYHVTMPETGRSNQPMTLGSYKPPVESGNIDFYPLYPNGQAKARQPAYAETEDDERATTPSPTLPGKAPRQNISKPFTPLSSSDCLEIVKAIKAAPQERYLALTFDDGPHHTYTREILDILKNEGARGTFFVVGSRAETYPDILARMAAEGHDIGNHTWEHRSLAKASHADGLSTLRRTNDLISGITAKSCNIVRPPFGHTNSRVKSLLSGQGWHEVLWDSDSRDWQNKDPDRILYRVMKSAGPGSIVLFHDIHPGAARMLPTLIRAFKSQGYRFVTISELIRITSAS